MWTAPQPGRSTSPAVTYSTSTPDEEKVDESTYSWQGLPDDPKYISLPTINASGFIQHVGVDQNQQIAVTTNIHFAGWFVDSAKPGQKGLSIIDGHVTGRQNNGIFERLAQINQGDEFTIELGDGSVKKYVVTGKVTLAATEAASALFSQDPANSSQLNLITCAGNIDENGQYEQRVIVSSKLLN